MINLKRIYRAFIQKCEDFSEHIRIKKQKIAEKIEIKKYNKAPILAQYKLSKAQKKEIDCFFLKNLGRIIPYDWHKKYAALSGNFVINFFPEILYTTELEPLLNSTYMRRAYSHKNMTELIYSKVLTENKDVCVPNTIIGCCEGNYYINSYTYISKKQYYEYISNLTGEFIVKESIDSSSGESVELINTNNGIIKKTDISLNQYLIKYGHNFIVQEKIKETEELKQLHPESVNTIRIMTYRVNGSIKYTPAVVRIGRGNHYLDNAHAGGIYVGINDDGTLCSCALDCNAQKYLRHPDLGYFFSEKKISQFPRVINVAKELHKCLPGIGFVSWDFAINTKNQVVLIEGNLQCGSIWMIQNAHGKGAFGKDTPYMLSLLKNKSKNNFI